jgi:polyphosphate kinase
MRIPSPSEPQDRGRPPDGAAVESSGAESGCPDDSPRRGETVAKVVSPVAAGTTYLNRELSWLEFNARVLHMAEDPAIPLLERVRFLAIFNSNLDEFFQVRVAALKERQQVQVRGVGPDGLSVSAQLRAIRERVDELVQRQSAIFREQLVPALAHEGIQFVALRDLDEHQRKLVDRAFEDRIFPVLTPLAVDPAHPFPYISNLSLNLAVVVGDPLTSEQRFARVKVPPMLPRFVQLGDEGRFLPIEELIAASLPRLFPGMDILTYHPFRVTRNADVSLDDDAEDLLQALQEVLLQRTKFSVEVRLEVDTTMDASTLDLLVRELELTPDEVYVVDGLLALEGAAILADLDRRTLLHPHATASTPPGFSDDPFGVVRTRDVLVHHPYESFATTVEAFIASAANDPGVVAIKQTLYRTGGDEAGIVAALAAAARAGKQVAVVIELQARFDEETNIDRAQRLEEAGVHVVYGLVGLKTHAKATLVVRQEHDGIRRYCHIGTGNYNPKTARIYEDLGLFSSDEMLCFEVAELFNHLTGYSRPRGFTRLLVAPSDLRTELRARIDRQAHPGGRIVMKMNSLADEAMIGALYDASRKGCEIDLLVRGICCLVPGVPEQSDHIRVRSLIGRYLEHSRIYCFGSGDDAEYLIGSADLMSRNLDRRVEALVVITDGEARRRLAEILAVELDDDMLAWLMDADGTWSKATPTRGLETHLRLHDFATARNVVA